MNRLTVVAMVVAALSVFGLAIIVAIRGDAADDRETELRLQHHQSRMEHQTESRELSDEIQAKDDRTLQLAICERLHVPAAECFE